MAKLYINVHSDIRDNAEDLINAVRKVTLSIEEYYNSIFGCENEMDENYTEMLRAAQYLTHLISKKEM